MMVVVIHLEIHIEKAIYIKKYYNRISIIR